ncbi:MULTISPECIES: hypothetical protein [unclassified Rathayibacter]|nr:MULTISPECIES: hypothetical protein [unclassified Rathayibacter]MBF4461803.1 hypothetical protein [Rathayibacter sp. VKM Ac-2879]MBF4503216.1 hypothetical protein [Rathayibacter sp. VKM Ac-2878]
MREMEGIALWLEAFLEEKGFATTRGTSSTLSFLREAVDSDESLGERYA